MGAADEDTSVDDRDLWEPRGLWLLSRTSAELSPRNAATERLGSENDAGQVTCGFSSRRRDSMRGKRRPEMSARTSITTVTARGG